MPQENALPEGERRLIEQQIADLMKKATDRPAEQDRFGIAGMAATLIAAKLQFLLLQEKDQYMHKQE